MLYLLAVLQPPLTHASTGSSSLPLVHLSENLSQAVCIQGCVGHLHAGTRER
jgi:hypothetical protein